jgi:cyclin-dependent kinase-like
MQSSKYEVLGIVGEGAYGIVYKCKNKENNDFVAIKKFKETEDDIVKKSMLRELKVLKILKHENIVEFKEAFKRKNNLFLVFEYVEKTLLELLQQKPKGLDSELIRNIIFQLCKAIKYLHDQNIIHRDIKPENLLIDPNYKLKLCDFGFARSISKNKEQLTDYVATRWYRSPELLLGNGYYGNEMDYWAIGCIMGELTDGEPLFPGEDEVDQIICIMKVLGKITEEQLISFAKNPRFNGVKLPEITKPETLEKRYSGKLNKTAINFMKQLLHPDPNLRLKGEQVFQHPYLEPFKNMDPNNLRSSPLKDTKTKSDNFDIRVKKFNSNNPTPFLSESLPKEKLKMSLSNPPVISNTTNINIINYNFDKEKKHDLKKAESENSFKNSKNSMVLTTLNFPKEYKENLINMYGGTVLDNNFKTFYKNDKYNYEIDLNFKNTGNNKQKLVSIDEEEPYKKTKSFPKNFKESTSKLKHLDIINESEVKGLHNFKKPKNEKILVQKNTSFKYPVFNNTKNTMNNFYSLGLNLPNISLKNFKIKK